MVFFVENGGFYLKGNDPIGDTPILDFHVYGRKGIDGGDPILTSVLG